MNAHLELEYGTENFKLRGYVKNINIQNIKSNVKVIYFICTIM